MILVLASVVDQAAASFANDAAASLCTTADLATHPIALRHPDFSASRITLGARTIGVTEIDGVVNLLPAVFPDELVFFPEEEREYQSAELHALLVFFLRALRCPVINRPSPIALTGGCAGPIDWLQIAHRLDIPIMPVAIDSDRFEHPFVRPPAHDAARVSWLEGMILEPTSGDAARYTDLLARHTGVSYLRATYEPGDDGGLELRAVRTLPDVRDATTRAALLRLFGRA